MNRHSIFIITLFANAALLLAACAASPFKMEGVSQGLTPSQTLDNTSHVNKKVVWGGMVVETRNFKNSSQMELLNYPLDHNGEPIRTAQPQGRLLIKVNGFLDPAQYNSGRWVSALGIVRPSEAGKIGDVSYHYPVMQAEQVHIWSEYSDSSTNATFHFGIGIGF